VLRKEILSDKNRKRIVVAEDDAAIMELISVRLDIAGYHVITARTGFQALDRVSASGPAGLVLDIGLPHMDGFDVLREVRRRMPGLPVLILTARRAPEDVHRAIGLGAHCYMVKPFDDKQLLDRVALMTAPQRVAPSVSSVGGASWEI
jgi:two-component system catabolic regulation response regulator CreB